MIEVWRKQFTKENFLLSHPDPHVFFKSQWQQTYGPSIIYLGLRWTIALFFLIVWILSIIFSQGKWTIYLTDWGLTVCTFQALLSAMMVTVWVITYANKDFNIEQYKKPLYLMPYKIYWAANTIATDLAFLISIVYWSLLYDSNDLDTMNVMIHAMNSVLMLLDLMVVAHPVRIVHFYLPVFFGIVYLVFSLIYWSAGGTDRYGCSYIYTILDWNKPGQTSAFCIGVLFFYLILHLFSFGVYSLRMFLFKKLRNGNKSHNEMMHSSSGNHPMQEVYINQGMSIKEVA
ncbi:protein rolling stone [Agrilus planipennis]|uniref:Protein rolling stone n=1 Tax=Agrilus planipennis TaxID=224129 RepID=A0A1W4WQF2_AGRPL|nr:protein rolling stone [Agrilus planipennis]XP_018322707.1 protein rolling stone [Agrilus planipennis]XP_018322708.1 protein rolling stone [Agrilus planipennis]XP_018322709.1 protein rolling stone [Agrilus planipennis]